MRLIVSQYLASLKERNELDAILPDLLSQLGLIVISRPRQGTRQDGVDVAAIGSLDGGSEKVYLFSIKAGDLTRTTWNGETAQSLRPSLDDILDAYIPNRIPDEHKEKDIVICLCFGGEIQEQVRPLVKGYIDKYTTSKIKFEEWNGDLLASYILSSFLQEDLLPKNAQAELRKSLALLNEPESSYQYFLTLVKYFSSNEIHKDKDRIKVIRQINICLWILFAWSRDAGSLEAAYLASELSVLHAWEMAKGYFDKDTKAARDIQSTFISIQNVYLQITTEFLSKNIIPHTSKIHALSTAVRASCSLDVNLKLFDILGRLATRGIWAFWRRHSTDEAEIQGSSEEIQFIAYNIKLLIKNNPALLLPIKDDQAIDISIAIYLLAVVRDNHEFIIEWLSELVDRASFAYHVQSQYPCILHSYNELLEHPQRNNDSYSKEVTASSILFPTIALWAALLGNKDLYIKVQTIKETHLKHCNFQFWYPDDSSEEHFYKNSDIHGAVLSHVCIDRSMDEFIAEALGECEHSPHFDSLSAIKNGFFPMIIIACRHYRLPIPLQLVKELYEATCKSN
jgi:hypothetical protein